MRWDAAERDVRRDGATRLAAVRRLEYANRNVVSKFEFVEWEGSLRCFSDCEMQFEKGFEM